MKNLFKRFTNLFQNRSTIEQPKNTFPAKKSVGINDIEAGHSYFCSDGSTWRKVNERYRNRPTVRYGTLLTSKSDIQNYSNGISIPDTIFSSNKTSERDALSEILEKKQMFALHSYRQVGGTSSTGLAHSSVSEECTLYPASDFDHIDNIASMAGKPIHIASQGDGKVFSVGTSTESLDPKQSWYSKDGKKWVPLSMHQGEKANLVWRDAMLLSHDEVREYAQEHESQNALFHEDSFSRHLKDKDFILHRLQDPVYKGYILHPREALVSLCGGEEKLAEKLGNKARIDTNAGIPWSIDSQVDRIIPELTYDVSLAAKAPTRKTLNISSPIPLAQIGNITVTTITPGNRKDLMFQLASEYVSGDYKKHLHTEKKKKPYSLQRLVGSEWQDLPEGDTALSNFANIKNVKLEDHHIAGISPRRQYLRFSHQYSHSDGTDPRACKKWSHYRILEKGAGQYSKQYAHLKYAADKGQKRSFTGPGLQVVEPTNHTPPTMEVVRT